MDYLQQTVTRTLVSVNSSHESQQTVTRTLVSVNSSQQALPSTASKFQLIFVSII